MEDIVENQVEGLKDSIQSVKDYTENLVSQLREFIEEQIDTVKDMIDDVRDLVEEQINDLISRIKDFGKNIGNVINGGIVDPFIALFEAIGNVFAQLFNIIIELGEKVKSMPGCTFMYIFQGSIDAVFGIINWILPKFIEDFFKMIYRYTLKIPVDFIAEWSGYNDYYDKCYKFDVKSEVNSIKQSFNEASSEFKNSFGDMNFDDVF